MIAYALHLGRLPPCHPTSSRSLYLDSGWCGGDGGSEKEGDREDERMGGCDAKYTHLSTPRARSLLCDSPSLGQAELKKLYKRTGLCYVFSIFCSFIYFERNTLDLFDRIFPIGMFG